MKKEVYMEDGVILMKITYLPLEPVAIGQMQPIEIKSNGLKSVKVTNRYKSHVIC